MNTGTKNRIVRSLYIALAIGFVSPLAADVDKLLLKQTEKELQEAQEALQKLSDAQKMSSGEVAMLSEKAAEKLNGEVKDALLDLLSDGPNYSPLGEYKNGTYTGHLHEVQKSLEVLNDYFAFVKKEAGITEEESSEESPAATKQAAAKAEPEVPLVATPVPAPEPTLPIKKAEPTEPSVPTTPPALPALPELPAEKEPIAVEESTALPPLPELPTEKTPTSTELAPTPQTMATPSSTENNNGTMEALSSLPELPALAGAA